MGFVASESTSPQLRHQSVEGKNEGEPGEYSRKGNKGNGAGE